LTLWQAARRGPLLVQLVPSARDAEDDTGRYCWFGEREVGIGAAVERIGEGGGMTDNSARKRSAKKSVPRKKMRNGKWRKMSQREWIAWNLKRIKLLNEMRTVLIELKRVIKLWDQGTKRPKRKRRR